MSDDVTKLWQQIVAEQGIALQENKAKKTRWPPESIKLANECARLAALMLEMWDTEHDYEWQYMLKPESYESIKAMFGRARQERATK